MNITDVIRERSSVRTFDKQRELTADQVESINRSIAEAKSPFGGGYKIEFKKFDLTGPQRPGTYGAIDGAQWFLLMGVADSFEARLAAGFAMQQVVLHCTSLGLGTCWMGATFKSADFARGVDFPADEPLRIISPVGYAAGKRRIIEKLTRAVAGADKRKPFDSMFFENDFSTPVSADSPFRQALEMMRLAPSATNSQPWRALVEGNTVYFYYENKSAYSVYDLGIGMCNFFLTLQSEGKAGSFGPATDAPSRPNFLPAASFTLS